MVVAVATEAELDATCRTSTPPLDEDIMRACTYTFGTGTTVQLVVVSATAVAVACGCTDGLAESRATAAHSRLPAQASYNTAGMLMRRILGYM